MRKLIMLTAGVATVYLIVSLPALHHMFNGYEDYVIALGLSALIAPFIAPLWE